MKQSGSSYDNEMEILYHDRDYSRPDRRENKHFKRVRRYL